MLPISFPGDLVTVVSNHYSNKLALMADQQEFVSYHNFLIFCGSCWPLLSASFILWSNLHCLYLNQSFMLFFQSTPYTFICQVNWKQMQTNADLDWFHKSAWFDVIAGARNSNGWRLSLGSMFVEWFFAAESNLVPTCGISLANNPIDSSFFKRILTAFA